MTKEIERIGQLALRLLAEKHGDDLIIHHIQRSRTDRCDLAAYRVYAGYARAPNKPSLEVALDEAGNRLDLDDLLKRFGRDLFEPDYDAVKLAPLPPTGTVLQGWVSPAVNRLTLRLGETHRETITVTIPRTPLTVLDVYFLADVTGSMGPMLGEVKATCSAILAAIGGAGPDFAAGVGGYRDFPGDPATGFMPQQRITTTIADAQAAIDAWVAGGEGDAPEGQLFALDRIAADEGGEIGWRPGSVRVLVWFGDAPGHEPICRALTGLPYDITTSSVAMALANASIKVVATSVGERFEDLMNRDPRPDSFSYGSICGDPGGAAGQADIITSATGGQYSGRPQSPQNIANFIMSGLTTSTTRSRHISLIPFGTAAEFVHTVTPSAYEGLAVNKDHRLEFTIEFLGVRDCGARDQGFWANIAVRELNDDPRPPRFVGEKWLFVTVPKCLSPPLVSPPYDAVSSPAAVAIESGRAQSGAAEISVFVAGSGGQMFRAFNTADPSLAANWRVEDLGRPGGPGGTALGDAPVAVKTSVSVVGAFDSVHAFAKGTGLGVHHLMRSSSGWSAWDFEGAMANPAMGNNSPAAVAAGFGGELVSANEQRVFLFFTGSDDRLYSKATSHFNAAWVQHGAPAGVQLVGPPAALSPISPGLRGIYVFVVGFDGDLHASVATDPWLSTWTWVSLGRPAASAPPIIGRRPAAIAFQDGVGHAAHVFVPTVEGLAMLQWSGRVAGRMTVGAWTQLGRPEGVTLRGSPSAVQLTSGGVRRTYAFMRGSDNELWVNVREAGGGVGQWICLFSPPGAYARSDPSAVVVADDDPIYVFVRGSDEQLHYCLVNATASFARWRTIPGGAPS